MKTRTALAGASIAALIAAGGVGWGYSDPSSPALGPLTSVLGAVVLGHVKNNAALANLPARIGRARRDGALTANDGGAAEYSLSATACSAPDGGTQIPLNGGGCAIIDPSTSITPELFPASADQAIQWQLAATALCSRSPAGGRVSLAATTYQFTGKSAINPTCPVQFDGKGFGEMPGQGGTWVHIASTGSTANGGTTPFQAPSQGVAYERFGVYQDQPTPASGWAPTPYPFVFNVTQYDVKIRNIAAAPVYDFINIAAARSDVCGIQGQPIHTGYVLDNSYDVTHSSCGSIEFYPFWSQNDYVMSWQAQNGTAIVIAGADGAVFPDVFAYGYQNGVIFKDSPIALSNSSHHMPSGIVFSSLYLDSVAVPLSSPNVIGQGYYQYPYDISITNLLATCYGVGADVGSGKNSVGYAAADASQPNSTMLNVVGAVDIDIQHVNVEKCAGPIIGLTNSNYGSQVRIGTFEASSAMSNLVTAATVTTNGSTQHDISFSQRPLYSGFDFFNNPGSQAVVNYPQLPGSTIGVVSNSSYQYPNNELNLALSGASPNGISGVTIALPSSPVDRQTASITPIVNLGNVALTTATPNTTITGYTTGNLAAYSTIKLRYLAVGNIWYAY